MQARKIIHAIRESLQVILAEEITTPRQVSEVRKIGRLLNRLEAQIRNSD